MQIFPKHCQSPASRHLDRHVPLWYRHLALGRCRCHFSLSRARDLLRCFATRVAGNSRSSAARAGRSRSGTSARAAPVRAKRVQWGAKEKRRKARLSVLRLAVTKKRKKWISTRSCSRLFYRLRERQRLLKRKTHRRSPRAASLPVFGLLTLD